MQAIIVDMDGTLCDVEGVRHYVTGEHRDFRSFHEASRFCPTRPEVEDEVRRAHADGLAVIIVTARDARFERTTRDFLARHTIPFDALYMRPYGDQRRDTAVKDEIFDRVVADGFCPVRAIDDRHDVAEVWRSHGLDVLLVGTPTSPA